MLRLNFIAHQYTKDSFCKTSESFVSQSLPFCTLCHSFLLSRFEFNPNVGGVLILKGSMIVLDLSWRKSKLMGWRRHRASLAGC